MIGLKEKAPANSRSSSRGNTRGADITRIDFFLIGRKGHVGSKTSI